MKREYPVIDIYKTGQNIKRIMQLKGMTVKEVQEYLELGTPQSIYHWFDGRNLPTVDNLYALSELFHVSVDVLLKGNRTYAKRPCRDIFCQGGYVWDGIEERTLHGKGDTGIRGRILVLKSYFEKFRQLKQAG